MSINKIKYSDFWKQLLPPILRQPKQLAWGTSLTEPLQINNDLFNEYLSGSTGYTQYDITQSYTGGTRVYYTNDVVYESISGSTSGITPDDNTKWLQINPSFIGAVERSKMDAIKMTYELALNRHFRVSGFTPYITINIDQNTFSAANNNIYIQNENLPIPAMLMGHTGPYSSSLSKDSRNATSYMGNSYSAQTFNCYTIYVPNYIYSGITENTIRSYADELNMGGMIYAVSGY